MKIESKTKTGCDRCGTCCTKGGPALHSADRELIQNNTLKLEHLITIRKGEPVFSLDSKTPEPTKSEFIKIKGRSTEWTCLFYMKKEATCEIYDHRPLECSLLQCWETTALEKMAGKDILNRHDILSPHDPVLSLIKTHEEKCSLQNLTHALSETNRESTRNRALPNLTNLVNSDMAIRAYGYTRFNFSLDLELFFLGRPLFKILQQYGIKTIEENGVFRLALSSRPSDAE